MLINKCKKVIYMKVLGIETSCDETSVAIVDEHKNILSHKIYSQIKEHAKYGGVVPEIAARSHVEVLPNLIKDALDGANVTLNDIDAIAATRGPGLIGGLLVGLMTAKGIAASIDKPLIGVNHLEGHALTVRLTNEVEFPFLLLLVSGGHCQILLVKGVGHYQKLGTTLDDAIGEAYDKVAKMLGLGYPGGPIIEQYAKRGNPHKYSLPKSMVGREGCDFSLSGLKTAVRRIIDEIEITEDVRCDIAASFQYTVAHIIKDRLTNAIDIVENLSIKTLVVAGGVAANQYLKNEISTLIASKGMEMVAPPLKLCTDNAAMIAWVGIEKLRLNQLDSLDIEPKSRWPLDENFV